jgi:hypothetical protein
VPGESLTEKAHILRKMGYDGMAIFVDAPDWKDELLDEMLQMEEKTGVKPCEFVLTAGYYGHLMNKDPEIRAQALEAYKQSIAITNKIGAITEMEYEYRTQDPLPLFEPYQQMPEEEKQLYVSIVNELGACVKPGAAMLIESCNRYETKYMTRLCDCVEMLERADLAIEIRDMAGNSDAAFQALRLAYNEEASMDDGLCYLATNVDYESINMGFMDDIADALAALEVGEVTVVSSDYGYHVIRRYEVESGAYANKDNAQWFTDSAYGVYDFITNLENELFLARIADTVARIETDEELLASVTIKQVAPNYTYR